MAPINALPHMYSFSNNKQGIILGLEDDEKFKALLD
jgi:hypothetical protein